MNPTQKPIVFLDVDGVLNCASTTDAVGGYVGIDDELLANLQQLVNGSHADIVLTTTWKWHWYKEPALKPEQDMFANHLDEKLSQFGLKAIEKTNERFGETRADAISRYLKQNNVPCFVILDDLDLGYTQLPSLDSHWVRTSFDANGFDQNALLLAKSILGAY